MVSPEILTQAMNGMVAPHSLPVRDNSHSPSPQPTTYSFLQWVREINAQKSLAILGCVLLFWIAGQAIGNWVESFSPARALDFSYDLNQVTRAELVQIRGLGPAKADALLAYRENHGPFSNLKELRKIPGFGPVTVAKVKHHLYLLPSDFPKIQNPQPATPIQSNSMTWTVQIAGVAKKSKKELDLVGKPPIDINHASRQELQKLPGIGPALAQRIADFRDRQPFRSVQDLTKVKGIGPKILAKLQPYVTVQSEISALHSVK